MLKSVRYLSAVVLAVSFSVYAGVQEDVTHVRQEWERVKYQLPAREQASALETLAKESGQVAQRYPQNADAAIWHGIVEASYAGAKGGLGALSLARGAKKSFEDALAIDPGAMEGSAYTSLGSLYYQVPGWPVGFGDKKKAAELLRKGLDLNPNGIDANYFYADFLSTTGDYEGAEQALRKALNAPPREGRKLADDGRRKEVEELLAKVREKKR